MEDRSKQLVDLLWLVKPVKPKYWLLGSLNMEPEKIYKLL
jgi:hypothetical protein